MMTHPSAFLSRRGLFGAAVAAAGTAALLPRLAVAQTDPACCATPPGFTVKSHDRKIGDMTLTSILDGYFPLGQDLITGVDAATIAAALTGAYLDPAAPVPLAISAHLIRA